MERGYKALHLAFTKEGEPYLQSGTHTWVSGENISDFPEKGREEFEKSSHGFYAKKTLGGLISDRYYQQYGPITVELIPYGTVVHGSEGYRSKKARLSGIFYDKGLACYVCGKGEAKWMISPEGAEPIAVCESCLKLIKKAVSPVKSLGEKEWEEILQKLSKKYKVPLIHMPSLKPAFGDTRVTKAQIKAGFKYN